MKEEERIKLQEHLINLLLELTKVQDDKKASNAGYNEVINGLKENIEKHTNAIKHRDMQYLFNGKEM